MANENKIRGYLVDQGKILGEIKNYDPHSRNGEIRLYDTPLEFVYGYLPKDINVVSEDEIKNDSRMRQELEITQFEVWRHINITKLIYDYDKVVRDTENFDRFCYDVYKQFNEKGDEKNG